MTMSLVARAAAPRMFGLVVASSSPAVAARCAHARAGAGAVATQNITDPQLGPLVLDALARGESAARALEVALASTRFAAYRQLLVIGAEGAPAVHSGDHALGCVASALGTEAAAAGNLLANESVPQAMLDAFAAAHGAPEGAGAFAGRLLAALRAGAAQGGEAGPMHSAGLLIVREVSWPIVDLRIDWCDGDPVAALASLWARYAPQVEDYVMRALDPTRAPRFGVPGDP